MVAQQRECTVDLKMVKMANSVVFIFYHNFYNREKKVVWAHKEIYIETSSRHTFSPHQHPEPGGQGRMCCGGWGCSECKAVYALTPTHTTS